MITNQSIELKNFYLAYQRWVQCGSPRWISKNLYGFTRREGLCDNLDGMYRGKVERAILDGLLEEMSCQFAAHGLSRGYPFGMDDYTQRFTTHTMDECPKRLAWVDMMCSVPGVA